MDRVAIAFARGEAHRLRALDDLEVDDAAAVEDAEVDRLLEAIAERVEAGAGGAARGARVAASGA